MCPAQCRAQGKTISMTVDCTALLPAEFNHFLYSNGTINLQTVPVEVEVRLYLSRCSLKRKKKKPFCHTLVQAITKSSRFKILSGL